MTLSVDLRTERGAFAVAAAFAVRPGEILAVIGPNGSGKSTLLDAIAGNLPSTGRVAIGDRVLDDSAGPAGDRSAGRPIRLAPAERRLALLGQRPVLFPHLSVQENVAFGPRAQAVPHTDALRAARARLAEVGLLELAERRPARLSGGQQQRVAIARALASTPEALLLDEPFAALDAQTATQARRLIAAQRDDARIPILLVTHDPMDALLLASRTLVLQEGVVVQQAATAEVLGHPHSPFVAALVGVNRLTGSGSGTGAVRADGIDFAGHGDPIGAGAGATVVFAPGSVRVLADADEADDRATAGTGSVWTGAGWTGTVAELEPAAAGIRIRTAEHPAIAADCPSTVAVALGLRPGQRLRFRVSAEDVSIRREA
ncbi:sulfate/molybdate ABC transporter ATP-binding protein [uncultured Microbacterium sp.]|uniref:sulfate/molybdate ABC transporter ATP-binding protein n=1 Tax=uncultured Microbacterium sp. TaxID=191216 RepID=UPI0025DED7C7|nr:ATP-binding cassette domain-containing protein [uncultured Microbacterium sp.]